MEKRLSLIKKDLPNKEQWKMEKKKAQLFSSKKMNDVFTKKILSMIIFQIFFILYFHSITFNFFCNK